MALPVKAPATDTVDLDGEKVEVRGLTRAEVIRLGSAYTNDADAAEVYLVACGTGVTEAEATEWRDATDAMSAGLVIDRIGELTGLRGKDGKDPKKSTSGTS